MSNKRWIFWLLVGITFFVFLYLIRAILLPFVLGIFIAYFLHPTKRYLQKTGLSPWLSTSLVIGVFFLVIVALSVLIIPLIVSQFSALMTTLPGYISDVEQYYVPMLKDWLGNLPPDYVASIKTAMAGFSGGAVKLVGGFISEVFLSGMALLNILSLILIMPIVAFYMLYDWDTIVAKLDSLVPPKHADTVRQQLKIIDRTLAGFLRGQLNVCLLLATYYTIGLTLVGLKFGAVIGFITGFLVIFPYVGLTLGTIIGLVTAMFQFDDHAHVLMVLAVFVSGQIIEANFVTPKLVGKKVGLHPVWIIFGMLAGATLFGFVGILLAVPVTAIAGVLTRFALQRYRESAYYRGEPKSRTGR